MALKPITELGPSNPIYPFMLLFQYRILVCQNPDACLANEVATHLAKKHPGIEPGARRRLVDDIKVISNVLQSQVKLSQLQYPPPSAEPILCLTRPKLDVLECRHCSYKIRQVQAMQEHYAKSHGWVNPRGKGRPTTGHPTADPLPCSEGVAYQRFFPSREGSKWFQVNIRTKGRADRSKPKPSTKKPQGTPYVLTSEAYQKALSQPQAAVNDTGTDTFATTSLWLDRTQWPSLYRGPRRDVLRALTRLPDRYSLSADYTLGQGTLEGTPNLISPREDEQKISCIVRALDSVIGRCEDTVRCTSHNLLCWLLSSRLRSRREFTFNLVAERSSEVRYRRTQKQFLAFILQIYRISGNSQREIINNYLDVSKGTWPVVERQGSSLVGTHSSPIGGQSIDDSLNTRTREELDVKERAEDGEVDKENVEAWELEDDESDYNDSGYYTDIDGSTAGTHQDLFSGLCIMLSTETFLNGQPSSTLLIYFSGILGLSAASMIYIQRILSLEQALPLRGYRFIGIPQRPEAGQFECFDKVRAKYMVPGSQYPLAELISLRDFGRNCPMPLFK
ncbi:hypothetical protein QL093DRAFT_2591171 [Fusarium oxysporum]|nr:hypothetical protein QL093DRAFT_2591171 [Fusarium oxysporum]